MPGKSASTPSNPRPVWIPPGVDFDKLSPEVQGVLVDLIGPAYQDLVEDAPDGLQRTVGFSYVQMAWLELVQALALNAEFGPSLPKRTLSALYHKPIEQYLRLVSAKDKVAKFLREIQKYKEKLGHRSPSPCTSVNQGESGIGKSGIC
jgi:hypothetical protein